MAKIIVVGLGPGHPKHLTREAGYFLQKSGPVYFRTLKHPSARYSASKIKHYYSFDRLYDRCNSFEHVYRLITRSLIMAARKFGTVCYAVPGHPYVGEAVVEGLEKICFRLKIKLEIVDGLSFLEPLLSYLRLDLLEGVTVIDALNLDRLDEPCRRHLLIAQAYKRSIASSVKLKLLDLYPADYPVTVLKAVGMLQERHRVISLCELDHGIGYNHLTTIYLPPYQSGSIGALLQVMARLRSENGCPWDSKQTHHSLRQYLVEEAYEVISAIESDDDSLLCEELGDLLLQVVFHCQIAREEKRFDFGMVVDAIIAKLVRRHPHVFGSKKAANASEVKILWEQIKSDERNEEKGKVSLSLDHALPALLKAYKLQKRAAEAGFDWPCLDGPLDKAREELEELEEAFLKADPASIEEELGDYLFTLVNIARFLKINPEIALGKSINKFLDRFSHVLKQAEKTGRPINEFSLDELDRWWEEAKNSRK